MTNLQTRKGNLYRVAGVLTLVACLLLFLPGCRDSLDTAMTGTLSLAIGDPAREWDCTVLPEGRIADFDKLVFVFVPVGHSGIFGPETKQGGLEAHYSVEIPGIPVGRWNLTVTGYIGKEPRATYVYQNLDITATGPNVVTIELSSKPDDYYGQVGWTVYYDEDATQEEVDDALNNAIAAFERQGGTSEHVAVNATVGRARAGLDAFKVANDTTRADIVAAVQATVVAGITADWHGAFNRIPATPGVPGAITGRIRLRLGDAYADVAVNLEIPALVTMELRSLVTFTGLFQGHAPAWIGTEVVAGAFESRGPFSAVTGGVATWVPDLALRQTNRNENLHGINLKIGTGGFELREGDRLTVRGRAVSTVAVWARAELQYAVLVAYDSTIGNQSDERDFTLVWYVPVSFPSSVRVTVNDGDNAGNTHTLYVDAIEVYRPYTVIEPIAGYLGEFITHTGISPAPAWASQTITEGDSATAPFHFGSWNYTGSVVWVAHPSGTGLSLRIEGAGHNFGPQFRGVIAKGDTLVVAGRAFGGAAPYGSNRAMKIVPASGLGSNSDPAYFDHDPGVTGFGFTLTLTVTEAHVGDQGVEIRVHNNVGYTLVTHFIIDRILVTRPVDTWEIELDGEETDATPTPLTTAIPLFAPSR